jgi:hypothetical protein
MIETHFINLTSFDLDYLPCHVLFGQGKATFPSTCSCYEYGSCACWLPCCIRRELYPKRYPFVDRTSIRILGYLSETFLQK